MRKTWLRLQIRYRHWKSNHSWAESMW